jgi:hypothetical protein
VPDPLLHEVAASVDHDLHNSSFDFDLDLALAGWVIYGYIIYFSDDNDCQK